MNDHSLKHIYEDIASHSLDDFELHRVVVGERSGMIQMLTAYDAGKLLPIIGILNSGDAQIANQGKFTAADIPGKWMGVHPEWTGVIVFYPDGNVVRPHIGTGRWELASEGGETKLVIFWDGYRPSTSTMVSVDHFSEAGSRGMFHIYRVPPSHSRRVCPEPDQCSGGNHESTLRQFPVTPRLYQEYFAQRRRVRNCVLGSAPGHMEGHRT